MSTPPTTLEDIFHRQAQLQRESYGIIPGMLVGDDRAEYVRSQTLALIDELHEALGEVRWKPWQSPRGEMDADAFGKELTDALHFLVNLYLVAGWDATDVRIAYLKKAAVNARRQEQGYDGVSTKCPSCKRAMDEPT